MFSKSTFPYRVVLASGSPRRQQFLRDMGLDFEVRLKEVDEVYPDTLKAGEITDYLAGLKADAFKGEIKPNELLITSDTIVWLGEKAIGKPRDSNDAKRMLGGLSGKVHQVFTSVCLRTASDNVIFHDVTNVTFAPLRAADIDHYINTYKPLDKAGAYGIQDWIGLIGISRIEGSYTNVVGLPTEKLYRHLAHLSRHELT